MQRFELQDFEEFKIPELNHAQSNTLLAGNANQNQIKRPKQKRRMTLTIGAFKKK